MAFNAENERATYDESSICIDYLGDMKRLTIPVAGPPGTKAVVVQTAAPLGSKVVTFAFQRTGAEPKVPSIQPANSNEVLKSFQIKVYGPALMAEGEQHIFRTEGQYVYDLLLPIGPSDLMPAPVQPYDGNPVTNAGVNPSDFSTTIIPRETATPVAVNLISTS